MKTPDELREERGKLFKDFYNNINPERMPVTMTVPLYLVAQLKGVDPREFQYNYGMLSDAVLEVIDSIYSDSCPFNPVTVTSRPPMYYKLLGSQSFKMSESGFVQHPEVVGMLDSEYDELIKDPIKCIMDHILPRQYKHLDLKEDPYRALIAFNLADLSSAQDMGSMIPALGKAKAKNGYYAGAPAGSGGFTAAPLDFIADQLRSFSGMSTDLRRNREKVKEACERLLPFMYKVGMPANPNPEGAVGMPLHMPPFMRTKDAEELWFPTFKYMLEQFAVRGSRASLFVEADWTRFIDCLYDLPASTVLKCENGDPKEFKTRLGDKMILSAMYPLSIVKMGTAQDCIDKAKELLDIMMPGGGYIFNFDKVPLTLGDVNMENYAALSEYLRDNAKFDNPGQPYGKKLNSENFTKDESLDKPIESEYLTQLMQDVVLPTDNPLVQKRYDTYTDTFSVKLLKMFL